MMKNHSRIVIASCLFALAACGKSGGSAKPGPTPVGDTGTVIDLPQGAKLEKSGDSWTVGGSVRGIVNLSAGDPMPSDYNQEAMVRESNPPVLDHHGVLSKGDGGMIVFTSEHDGRRFLQTWVPAADGNAVYCSASGEGAEADAAHAVCRSLRSKGGKPSKSPGAAKPAAGEAAPSAGAPVAGEQPVTNMMMDPRIVEPCVTECDGKDDSGDPATSAYGVCFDTCKQRLADEINARVSGK